ncbi:hypothetical protein BRADI_3g33870v3 [Brachypodium distachyon]|uniref:VAN3-binding protein-like auxin canalisation domain-containing protein n=1 Tax=Brachypodium distachyon TaxID=15368 RepID=A0A2K2D0Y6_BRADI|nr:hypothetical protein BRADI_3g33870v3 [Brachypodium distachyon]
MVLTATLVLPLEVPTFMKMEHFRRGVEFGMASFQRCHSLSCQMAESMQIDAQKVASIRRTDKSSSRGTKCAEMPVIPEQAMEFLSRTWSPSSSDLFQILSPSCLGTSPEDRQEGEGKEDEDGEEDLGTVPFDGDKGQLFNQTQTWRVLASGKPSSRQQGKHRLHQPTWCLGASLEDRQEAKGKEDEGENEDGKEDLGTVPFDGDEGQLFNQTQTWRVLASGKPGSKKQGKHRLHQPTWLNVGQLSAVLRGYFLDSIVSVAGSQRRRRRRRDELRLHSAQAHAAVSVAQLAAAIAGIVSSEPREDSKKLGAVLASAAALVATVCAEAAERAGAGGPRVASAVRAGLETSRHSPAELLTLTAAAATCLRGAAALRLRGAAAADVDRGIGSAGGDDDALAVSISAGVQKGVALRVCLPCGRVRVRTVAVFPQRGGRTVALRLGKKRLRGAFATYDDHEVLGVSSSSSPGETVAVVDGRRCFAVALTTSAGTVRLLLEDQTHWKIWKAAIEGMLADAKLKHV